MTDYIWSALTPGNASVSTNWLPVGVPTVGDKAIFDASSTAACTWDITALDEIEIQSGALATITIQTDIALDGLSISEEGLIAAISPFTFNFSGTPLYKSSSCFVENGITTSPFDNATSRSNLTYSMSPSSGDIYFDTGIYPNVIVSTTNYTPQYISPTVANTTDVKFLTLQISANAGFAPTTNTPTDNDKLKRFILEEASSSQFVIDNGFTTFNGGYATWVFQAMTTGLIIPTSNLTVYNNCDFSFEKMGLSAETAGAGAWAKLSAFSRLYLTDLTIDVGASLKAGGACAIHLINRPTIKGTWGFFPIADGIYHPNEGEVLGVSDGGTGATNIPYTEVVYGIGDNSLGSDSNLTYDSTLNNLETVGVQFDATNTIDVASAGEMRWDDNENTVAVGAINGIHAHIGQTFQWSVKNQTGGTLNEGTVVMAVGTVGASGKILIDAMDASATGDAKLLVGILQEDVATGGDSVALALGRLKGIDLTALKPVSETWADGDILYCDQANDGGLTNVAPSSGIILPIGFIIHYHSNGSLAVRALPIDEGATGGGGGSGTVTSVDMAVPTGFAISGNPITSSGTLTLAYDTGYALPTTAKQTEWDTAYGWGDHSAAGYLTSFTESDPVFSASQAALIINAGSGDVSQGDTAFGWGDHALAGYLTTETDSVVAAINGIVKSNGAVISAAVEDTDYQGVLAEGAFADGDKTKLDGIPTGQYERYYFHSLSSTISASTTTQLTFGTTGAVLVPTYSVASDFSVPATNDRILINTAGLYQFTFAGFLAGISGGSTIDYRLTLSSTSSLTGDILSFRNRTVYIDRYTGSGVATVYLNALDEVFISVRVDGRSYQIGGLETSVSPAETRTFLDIRRVE